MAAIITHESYNQAHEISIGYFTHEKSPLGCVAASATMEYMKKHSILEKVQSDQVWMKKKMLELKDKYSFIGDVRGIGLLWGIELVKCKD